MRMGLRDERIVRLRALSQRAEVESHATTSHHLATNVNPSSSR